MKKVLIIICLAAGFGNVKAQSNKEDIDIIQSAFGKDKKNGGKHIHECAC